jgi:DNA end-binding protein Ku
VGIGTYVLRNKETLALLKPYQDLIVLNQLRFAEEIRNPDEMHLPGKTPSRSKELKMALSLVEQLTGEFNYEAYKDEYTSALMKMIKAKSKGVKTEAPKLRVAHRKSEDLMVQLKASLENRKKKIS